MKVRFVKDFDFKPTPRVTVAYLAGMERTVKRSCGERAVALGRAVRIERNKKVHDVSRSG